MLFWVIITVGAATIVIATIKNYREYKYGKGFWRFFWPAFGWGAACGALAAMFGGVIIAAVLIPITLSHSHVVSDMHEKRQLVSLQTAQQGKVSAYHYYLGSGIISGSSGTGYTYMYSAKDDNGSTFYQLDNAAASDSKVYTLDENSDQQPSVDIESAHWEASNKWLLPWAFDNGTGYAYTFYVPKDSIVSNYQAN